MAELSLLISRSLSLGAALGSLFLMYKLVRGNSYFRHFANTYVVYFISLWLILLASLNGFSIINTQSPLALGPFLVLLAMAYVWTIVGFSVLISLAAKTKADDLDEAVRVATEQAVADFQRNFSAILMRTMNGISHLKCRDR
jgi:hypothetical protein